MGYSACLTVAPLTALIIVVAMVALGSYRSELAARLLNRYLALSLGLVVVSTGRLLAPTVFLVTLAARLEYLPILLLPITFAMFCLHYTGHDRYMVSGIWIACAGFAALLFVAVATNELHGLFWIRVEYPVIDGVLTMRPENGPVFWVAAAFIGGLMALGCLVVIRSYAMERSPYRMRSIMMVAGALVPAALAAAHAFRLVPGLEHDYTPLGFAVSGLFCFVAVYRSRAAHVIPLARCVILRELEEGMLFIDSSGKLADYNVFTEKLLGLSSALLGQPVMAIHELDPVSGIFSSASVSSDGLAVATVLIAGRSIVVRARRIGGNQGPARLRGVVVSLADVTERVRMQDELDALRADLSKREHFAVIGRLSADIAHEISAPLDYIQAEFGTIKNIAAGSIGDGSVRARVFGMVQEAEGGLGSIDRVVHSLLEYARRCNDSETPVPYDLSRGVRTALELSRSDYSRVAVVDVDLGETPQVLARGSEIDRVLLNILRNAVAAVRERAGATGQPGRIWVKTRLEESSVVCEIGNDGRPLDEAEGPHVFEEFFSGKLGIKGSALGLSISKDIVERHHAGKLALVSRAPVVFRMELPLAEVTAPSP